MTKLIGAIRPDRRCRPDGRRSIAMALPTKERRRRGGEEVVLRVFGGHRQHRSGRRQPAGRRASARARAMGVSRAVRRLPRRQGRRQRRRWTLGDKYAKDAQAAAPAARLHVRGVQGALDAERLAADRHRSVQGDLARPGRRPGHAGVQVPARARPLGGHRVHQDAVETLAGGKGLPGSRPSRSASPPLPDAGRARGRQGGLRQDAVRQMPRADRQGRWPVRARVDRRQRPADQAARLQRRVAVRRGERSARRLPDLHHRARRHADAVVRRLPEGGRSAGSWCGT